MTDEAQIELSQEDSKRLDELANMINAGAEEFTRNINWDELSLKQQILYLNFGAVNNYAEAVHVLCSDLRPFPAIVILRSVVESYINTAYMLTHNSDRRVILFSMEDSYYRQGISKEIKKFLKKHPEFRHGKFDIETFEKGIKKTQEELRFYSREFSLEFENKKEFEKEFHASLLERARAVDKRLKKPNFEYFYLLAYRLYSEYAHLSMRGLDHFIERGKHGEHGIIASQHNEVEHVVALTFTVYLYFLNELKKRKMLSEDFPLGGFNKKWEERSEPH